MRRGVGVGHIKAKNERQQQMSDLGAQLKAEHISDVADQLELLKSRITDLAMKHKRQINNDPIVRARFKQLAAALNVDLLSSRANMLSKAFGLGEYYYALSVRVIEICMKERRFSGPLVPMRAVLRQLNSKLSSSAVHGGGSSGGWSSYGARAIGAMGTALFGSQLANSGVTEEDVRYALQKVCVLGGGYQVVRVDGDVYIQAAGELSTDSLTIITFVKGSRRSTDSSGSCGHSSDGVFVVTVDDVVSGLGWTAKRATMALDQLLQDGTAWIDEDPSQSAATVVSYWIMIDLG